jgi:hypothetical protein
MIIVEDMSDGQEIVTEDEINILLRAGCVEERYPDIYVYDGLIDDNFFDLIGRD